MYGVVTRNPEEVEWPEFDRGFYEVKDVTGRAAAPLGSAVNMISCFGDTAAANENPDLVPVDDEGNLATRDQTYFDWAYICPTNEKYRAGLLEIVEDAAAKNADVRLDDVGFPRDEYCHCERCTRQFSEWADERDRDTDEEARFEWRAEVITQFVREATDRIPGRTYFTLYPDPYPGHLYRRAGLDIEALSEYVDEFVIPLYDTNYGTTYWLETIARGFESLLEPYDVAFSIELYAVDVDVDQLIHAAEVADHYAKDVLFGYDASNAAATLRRMTADTKQGKTFHPDDATR
ncbi:hypothetical protein ACFQJC_08985 [Haloferax namakaokahaiae]|uniref:Glycoside hydrolase domain protein n=1 Tax=Haloferax namakaokahaiae TaxID=1748331 RepID=A0ABD5ZFI6_9EURY